MTRETTIRAIGNSAGITIPKPMLERYRMAEGDRVHLVETDEGILITPSTLRSLRPWLSTRRAPSNTVTLCVSSRSERASVA
jgi:antitoxin component of MazEF toxin-antitoxin module